MNDIGYDDRMLHECCDPHELISNLLPNVFIAAQIHVVDSYAGLGYYNISKLPCFIPSCSVGQLSLGDVASFPILSGRMHGF